MDLVVDKFETEAASAMSVDMAIATCVRVLCFDLVRDKIGRLHRIKNQVRCYGGVEMDGTPVTHVHVHDWMVRGQCVACSGDFGARQLDRRCACGLRRQGTRQVSYPVSTEAQNDSM